MPPELRQMSRIIPVDLAAQNVEVGATIPRRTKSFDIQARQDRDIRMAFNAEGTGNGPYWTIKSGTVYYKDFPLPLAGDITVYFRDVDNANTDVEIIVWEEDR